MNKSVLGLLPLVVVAAPAAAQPADEWVASITVIRNDPVRDGPVFTDDPTINRWSGNYFGFAQDWFSPADMPGDVRLRKFSGTTVTTVDTDATGRITACRLVKSSGDARLDAVVCRRLIALGHFPLFHTAPGKAVPHLNVSVTWSTNSRAELESRPSVMAPPAPPAPPDPTSSVYLAWPRLAWYRNLKIDAFPDLQAAYNALRGRHGEGETSLDLLAAPDGTVTCAVGVGSGDAVLDERACAIARALPLSYTEPCDNCRVERLPLKFVWRRTGSYIAVPAAISQYGSISDSIPRDPADPRPAPPTGYQPGRRPLMTPDSPRPKDFDFTRFDWTGAKGVGSYRMALTPAGEVTSCTTVSSSGVAEADAMFCRGVIGTRWQGIPTDVFGDAGAEFILSARLAPRQPQQLKPPE